MENSDNFTDGPQSQVEVDSFGLKRDGSLDWTEFSQRLHVDLVV